MTKRAVVAVAERKGSTWEERQLERLLAEGELVEWRGHRKSGFLYRSHEVIVDRQAYEQQDGLQSQLRRLGAGEPLPLVRADEPESPPEAEPAEQLPVTEPAEQLVRRREVQDPSLRLRLEDVPDRELPVVVRQLQELGHPVDLNYLTSFGQRPKWHPGGDPERGRPVSLVEGANEAAGKGTTVAVIDTGLHLPAASTTLLDGVVGEQDWMYEAAAAPGSAPTGGFLLQAGGHGTFVAGLVKRVAPGAKVIVFNVGTRYGFADLGLMLAALTQAFDLGCHVVNISLGTWTHDDRPLVTFDAALEALRSRAEHEVTVVASAGNDGSERPGYPAASVGVIGVAAVDWNKRLCDFSNRGPWVRAATYGHTMWSTFVPGDENPLHEPDGHPERWSGDGEQWAAWSGTSFAAPLVAGMVAAELGAGSSTTAAALLGPTVFLAGVPPIVEPAFQFA